MSFREKSAWISFIVILAVFGIYFGSVAQHLLSPLRAHGNYFHLFVALLVIVIVLEVVLHVLVAIRAPSEAAARRDERERFIELKATRVAFFVLMVGAFLSIGTIHVSTSPWLVGNAVFFAIWIAELTRLGSQVVLFRRLS